MKQISISYIIGKKLEFEFEFLGLVLGVRLLENVGPFADWNEV